MALTQTSVDGFILMMISGLCDDDTLVRRCIIVLTAEPFSSTAVLKSGLNVATTTTRSNTCNSALCDYSHWRNFLCWNIDCLDLSSTWLCFVSCQYQYDASSQKDAKTWKAC
mmetsp:Transcript_16999/g.30793  ORF Transcript_16999/g.30793 Transcript_16999/m.30793 type:complete len:112 (+) Transcript_16999:188-523(+)